MTRKALLISIVTVLACAAPGKAQQTKADPEQNQLVLEVQSYTGQPPTFQPVPRAEGKNWVWYSRFEQLQGWQLPPGAKPISAIRLTPWLDGEVVSIKVGAIRGDFRDADDPVGIYHLREGETTTASALQDFGVKPFVLKVTRVTPTGPNLPAVKLMTSSLEVAGVEPIISALPAFKLSLRNLSDKDIAMLSVKMIKDGKLEISGMPQGQEGVPLIKARSAAEFREFLPVRVENTPGGYQPATPSNLQFVVDALVFADGTYEGSAGMAVKYRAFVCGRKSELKRLVPVLEAALQDTSADGLKSPAKLRARVQEVSVELEESAFAEFALAFPTLKPEALRLPVEVSTKNTRKQLLDDLNKFEQGSGEKDFAVWLKATRDRYSAWLARL